MEPDQSPKSSEEMLREATDWLRDHTPHRLEEDPEQVSEETTSRWRADPTGGIVRPPDPNRPSRPGPGLERYRNELPPAAALAAWGLMVVMIAVVVVGVITRSANWASLPLTVVPIAFASLLAAKRR